MEDMVDSEPQNQRSYQLRRQAAKENVDDDDIPALGFRTAYIETDRATRRGIG